MNIRIENGVTIISTGRKSGDPINRTGITGLTYYPNKGGRYRLSTVYKGHKYTFPFCSSIEEGIEWRKEVDKHIADGTLPEWHMSLRKYEYQKLSKAEQRKYSEKLKRACSN